MKTLRIRTLTVLGLFLIVLVPWLFFIAVHFMTTQSLSLRDSGAQDSRLQMTLTETMHLIETNADKWTDPNWQEGLHDYLRQASLDAVILTAENRDIYRSNPERSGALLTKERFSVIRDGEVLGRVVIYVPKSNVIPVVAAVAGFLLAIFAAGLIMRRLMVNPLERMSLAARQIAAGDWDVRLPASKITEIAEVGDGFNVMVKGLQQSYRKQTELEEERRFVIAAVAHDLRTPLFALRGYLDGIDQGIAQAPDKLAKYLAVCKEKSAQLDRLVEELFAFTKIEYLNTELSKNTVDLERLLHQASDNVQPSAGQKHISVMMKHGADDFTIIGDAHLLERALNNLLDNAVRHTPPHGTISIECEKDGHRVVFAVRDTGPGFASGELERVFEPLYRSEASRNRATGGAGLGLTITRKIIRRHGGDLVAGNHPDGGAVLSGWLPAGANMKPD